MPRRTTEIAFPPHARPVGYAALVERHGLRVIPHHRWTFVADRGIARELGDGRYVLRPGAANVAMSDLDHLLFALRYDGVNLELCSAYFATRKPSDLEAELTHRIRAKPTGKYLRRLWFVYEWLTGRLLDAPDLEQGTYVPLLDPELYYVATSQPSRRHRVHNNLLGNVQFCPFVRRTPELTSRDGHTLRGMLDRIVGQYDPDVFSRAISFLYTKETLSSFAIERETPSSLRADRFAQLLMHLDTVDPWSESQLAQIQARIVDERFAEHGYRKLQNYVGESIDLTRQHVHYVPPKPEDVGSLMDGLTRAARAFEAHGAVDPVLWAACISFGFVFIHPFIDGNGRLHRFLIHHVLAKAGVTPPRVVVPVSAIMLSRRNEYDAALEWFSRPLMELIEYELAPDASVSVRRETIEHYRYVDYTELAEALYRWLEDTVRVELPRELDFIVGFRRTREAMLQVVDLPDRLADLFVKLCLQNGGHLSASKKKSHFSLLRDEEIEALERCVLDNMPERLVSRA